MMRNVAVRTAIPTPTSPSISITISRPERCFLVGTTGSGKTTLATSLLARANHTVVLDPKHGFGPPKGRAKADQQDETRVITDDPKTVTRHEGPEPIVYQPPLWVCQSLDWFWDWVWWREQTILYIDEVAMVIPSAQRLPNGLARLIQQGRQRGIGVWNATQRPSRIPIPILSESEHHFVFRLRHPADLRRMAEYTDPTVESEPVSGHDFYYYYDTKQRFFRTNLNEMKR
jgi:energy-coupling factor transporter ATP-binding protein EcfA2